MPEKEWDEIRGEKIPEPDSRPSRSEYVFPTKKVKDPKTGRITEIPSKFRAQAYNLETFAGKIDSTFIQFFPSQPLQYLSSDFLQNSLARMLGFDAQNKLWKPFALNEQGQIIIANASALQFPINFVENFNETNLDSNIWSVSGGSATLQGNFVTIDNSVTEGTYIRSKIDFIKEANFPIVLTTQITPTGTNDKFSFGFIQSDDTLTGVGSPTLNNGVYVEFDSDGLGVPAITLTSIFNGSANSETFSAYIRDSNNGGANQRDVNGFFSNFGQEIVFTLILEEDKTILYIDGYPIGFAKHATFDADGTPATFPLGDAYNVFIMNNSQGNGDAAALLQVYKVLVSTSEEILPVGGVDKRGNRKVMQIGDSGQVLVSQKDDKPLWAVIFGDATMTDDFADINASLRTEAFNTLTLYPTFTIGDGTSADILIEASPDEDTWHAVTFDVTPSGYTLQTDGSLRYTYISTGDESSRRILVTLNDRFIRVSLLENGATLTVGIALVKAQLGHR